MEQAFPPNTGERSLLEQQLREMYGRLAYTHKTHEKMADACIARYKLIKRWEIALSALSSGSMVIAIWGEARAATIVGALLSTLVLALMLYFKEEHLGQDAQKHTETASRLWGLREAMLSLLVDFRGGAGEAETSRGRDAINSELEIVYKAAPRTDGKAYAAAQEALKNAEELYFSESELDHLLPGVLRISKKPG